MLIRKTATRNKSANESYFTFRLVTSERSGKQVRQITLCRATIKVRIPDNQDEKVVAGLAPQGGRSPTGGASPATTGDEALSRASIVM
jgi:hypothetical protein